MAAMLGSSSLNIKAPDTLLRFCFRGLNINMFNTRTNPLSLTTYVSTVYRYIYIYTCMHEKTGVYLSVYLSIYLFIYLSMYLSICKYASRAKLSKPPPGRRWASLQFAPVATASLKRWPSTKAFQGLLCEERWQRSSPALPSTTTITRSSRCFFRGPTSCTVLQLCIGAVAGTFSPTLLCATAGSSSTANNGMAPVPYKTQLTIKCLPTRPSRTCSTTAEVTTKR